MERASYIKTQAGLESVISRLENSYILGCDTETTGLDPHSDRVRLLTLCTEEEGFLIDCFKVNPAPLFPLLSDKLLVFHNGLFDLQMMKGFEPGEVRDTYLASRVLNAGRRDIGNGLDDCILRYFSHEMDKEAQKSDWSGELTEKQKRYALHDAQVLVPLYRKMEEEAWRDGLEWTLEIENDCLPAVAWMAGAGVPFNPEVWKEQLIRSEREREESVKCLDSLAPRDPTSLFEGMSIRNWSSSPDIITVLKQVTGKTDIDSSDDAMLASIDHPICEELRKYRSLSARVERYGQSWIDNVREGRIFPKWSQLGSAKKDSRDVGRLACFDPCFNQIPRPQDENDPIILYRQAIQAPEGKVILKADYSAIHFRIACRICWERSAIEAFSRGEDVHKTTARLMYQLPPYAPVSAEQRQIAKSATYMFLYGGGGERARVYFLTEAGINKPLAWCKDIRDRWHAALPCISQWHTDSKSRRSETRSRSGRRRIIKEDESITIKLNSPVLGTEADGLKRSASLLWKRRADCREARLILLNHDEIVLEVEEGYEQKASLWLEKAMVDGMTPFIDPIPVGVESKYGRTWAGK